MKWVLGEKIQVTLSAELWLSGDWISLNPPPNTLWMLRISLFKAKRSYIKWFLCFNGMLTTPERSEFGFKNLGAKKMTSKNWLLWPQQKNPVIQQSSAVHTASLTLPCVCLCPCLSLYAYLTLSLLFLPFWMICLCKKWVQACLSTVPFEHKCVLYRSFANTLHTHTHTEETYYLISVHTGWQSPDMKAVLLLTELDSHVL